MPYSLWDVVMKNIHCLFMNRIFFPQRMVAGKFKINILEDSAFNEEDFPNIQHFPAEASHGSRQKAIIWHDFYESS